MFPLHNHVTNHWLWQLEKGCSVPDRFLTDVATNNWSMFQVTELPWPILSAGTAWATHSFLPPFIPVSAVLVISRLQFTITEGCLDTFDQIVYTRDWIWKGSICLEWTSPSESRWIPGLQCYRRSILGRRWHCCVATSTPIVCRKDKQESY
jgi:hypothetical protein